MMAEYRLYQQAIEGAFSQAIEEPPLLMNNPILKYGSRWFYLAHPIEVTIVNEDDLVCIASAELGIQSFGSTYQEAQDSFFEDFVALYEHLANETDEQLTPEARCVKRAFLDVVVSVAQAE